MPFAIYNVREVQKRLHAYCKQAGITGISLHSLRHSHATLLIRQNVPIPAIAKRLGHANPATTLRVYAHVYEESDNEIAKMLEIVSK
jgi:integrase